MGFEQIIQHSAHLIRRRAKRVGQQGVEGCAPVAMHCRFNRQQLESLYLGQ